MQLTPDFIRDPYPTYQRMRESHAAHRSEANEGALWFVPGYAEVCEALRDERFSAALKASWFLNQLAPEERAEFERFDSGPHLDRRTRPLFKEKVSCQMVSEFRRWQSTSQKV